MLLSSLIFLPFFSILLVVLAPERMAKGVTFISSLVHFIFSLLLFKYFDPGTSDLQLIERQFWLQEMGVSYFIGIDGISFWLVLLTTFLTPFVVLASWSGVTKQTRAFYVCLLILESAMIGSFLAFDGLLFYIFFELTLIPIYFIVGIWGGKDRIYASLKLFIYTMAGSLVLFAAIIYLIFQCDSQLGELSASLLDFYRLQLPFSKDYFINTQNVLFFVFSLAFAIKIPMFPFHTWLPDAHVQAPTGGSMILAGVMLKMGTYGFLRFVLPLFPQAVSMWAPLFMGLGVVGIIYGALVAMVQVDIKKLVAYSSVSHMGYVMIGLFSMNIYSFQGSLFQMLAHGINTGALFMLVGFLYERTHSLKIIEYGGLAKILPVYSICFLIFVFASIAVPMTNGFIGEFLILFGVFREFPVFSGFAVLGVVFGAVYMLWMVKKVFFGREGEIIKKHQGFVDMNFRELFASLCLILMVFWMGLFPKTFLKYSRHSLENLVANKQNYKIRIHKTYKAVNYGLGETGEF